MRHAGITNMDAQARRSEILEAYRANAGAEAIAAEHGVTPRYVLMIARAAGLSRPRGRPASRSKRTPAGDWRGAPATTYRRGGYSLLPTEKSAVL